MRAAKRDCSNITINLERREMLSQFTLSHLGGGDPTLTAKIAHIGTNASNMLQ